jgi:TonB family protein
MLNASAATGKAASSPAQRNLAFNTSGGAGGVGSAPGQNASAAILNAARESGRPAVVLQATQPPTVKVVRPDSEIQRLDVLAPSNYCPLPLPGHTQPDNRAPHAAQDLAERPAYSSDNPAINYPVLANIRGVEGRVTVRVEVLQDGRPGKMWLKQSSGFGILDQNAQEQLKQWRFVPARKNGQPVTAWIDVPVLYRLSQSRP